MSVNLTDRYEQTPLHISAHCGLLEATKALVERGAAINITNIHGANALKVARLNGKLEIFRYLTEIDTAINLSVRHLNAIKSTVGWSFLGFKPLPALQQM